MKALQYIDRSHWQLTRHRYYGEDPDRMRWQSPESILRAIGVKRGMTFMDIGCGDGFFAIPAAKAVSEKGKVYGLDIYDEAIRMLEERVKGEGLRNIVSRVGAAEETVFCQHCADIVFFANVLHDFDDASKVLVNAREMVKSTGKVVDLDWKKESMRIGPPIQMRFSIGHAANLIKSAGFLVESIKESGPYHYLIIASPMS